MERIDYTPGLNDGGNVGLPFRPGDRWRCIKHGNGSGFVAIAFFRIGRLDTRQRFGGSASGLDLLTKGGLVALELNDQMRGRGCGGLEGFFDNATRRR